MSTTVQSILDAAYAKSVRNQPGEIASETTELLQVVIRALRGFFSDGVKFNRKFYAKRVTVAYDETLGGWPRPAVAEAVIRMELVDGTRVSEVPFDDRKAEEGLPSVYSMGQVFYPAGNDNDPGEDDSLVVFYSARPVDLEVTPGGTLGGEESTLDPLWPEQFNELLVLSVAMYLARKDGGRDGELAAFGEEYAMAYTRYTEFLMHETTTLTRRYGHSNRINTSGVAS